MLHTEQIFQIIALIAGLIAWKHIRPAYLRAIVIILAITVLNETFVEPYIEQSKITSNDLGYNIFSFFDMIIWLFIFYKIHQENRIGKFIIPISIFVLGSSIYDIYFNTTWYKLHILSMMLYSFTIIILCIIYQYALLRIRFHNLYKNPLFWVSAACVIYHSLLFYNFFTLTSYKYWQWKNANFVFNLIQLLDNLFYYSLLTVTFVICIYYKQALKQKALPR